MEGEIADVQPISAMQLQKADNTLTENNNLTHVATIQISDIQGKRGSFDLVLEKSEDTWYQKWSTDDDSKVFPSLENLCFEISGSSAKAAKWMH